MKGYVFYNPTDEYCRNFMTLLNTHKIHNMFEYRRIDQMDMRQIVKLNIDTIPTLLIVSNQTKQLFKGKDAFDWITGFLIERKKREALSNEQNKNPIIQNNTKDVTSDNKIYAYSSEEHAGISDTYAYYNKDLDKDINIPQVKTFSSNLTFQNDNIGAIPIGNMSSYKSKEGLNAVYGNDSNIKNVLSQIQNDRHTQDLQLKQTMEQSTIQTVIKKLSNPN